MSLWDQVKANMLDWYSVAADKTEEMARIGVRRYDKFGISREIERELTQLGNHVYAALTAGREGLAHDATVRSAIERIQGLEQQLTAKDREIESIREEHRGRVVPRSQPAVTERGRVAGRGGDGAGASAAGSDVSRGTGQSGGEAGESDGGNSAARAAAGRSATGAADSLEPAIDEHAREAEPMVTAWSERGPVWDGTASDWVDDADDEDTLRDDWERRREQRSS